MKNSDLTIFISVLILVIISLHKAHSRERVLTKIKENNGTPKDTIKPNDSDNNYDTLFEQIYIERSVCIDSKTREIADVNIVDKATCEEYCKHNACQKELIQSCGNDSWSNYGNMCYKITPGNKKLTWEKAQARCSEYNGTLAIINNESVQKYITNLVKLTQSTLNEEEFFIGLLRRKRSTTGFSTTKKIPSNDDWVWINGENLTYTNWNRGEPNYDMSKEDCAELILTENPDEEGKWNDINCNEISRMFICQRPANNPKVNKEEAVYEFIKYREITEENVIKFVDLLNGITSRESITFSAVQVEQIVNILTKVSNLSSIPVNATKGYFGTVNNILNAPSTIYKNIRNTSNALLKTIDTTTYKLKLQANNETSVPVKVQEKNIGMTVNDIYVDKRQRNNDFSESFSSKDANQEDTAFISVITNFTSKSVRSIAINQQLNSSSSNIDELNRYRVSVLYFKSNKLFQPSTESTCSVGESEDECSNNLTIAGTILSVTVNTFDTTAFQATSHLVEYDVKYPKFFTNQSVWCGYWKFENSSESDGSWSDEGCEYLYYDEITDTHKCRCNHTTHYALLFTPYDSLKDKNKVEILVLTIVTYIGLALSIIGLLITLVTYILFKSLRSGVIHRTLIMLALCLLLSDVFFILVTVVKQSVNLKLCLSFAILLHYFLLVSFMWMLCISIAHYLTFVKVVDNHVENFIFKASLLSFGLPIVAPAILASLNVSYYSENNQEICWLSGPGLYISFVIPICIVCAINLGFFVTTVCSIFNRPIEFKINRIIRRNQISASICCFVLLGLTWLFGFFLIFNISSGEVRFTIEIIFAILNTTQGFFICLFHVLLSRTKRDLWNKVFETSSNKFRTKPFVISSSSNSAGTTGNTSNNQNIGVFNQTIKVKMGNVPASSNISSNKIIVNNNNIIMNHQKTENKTDKQSVYSNDSRLQQSSTKNNTTSTSGSGSTSSSVCSQSSPSSAIIPQQFYFNPQALQHHHYHHHVHHHNNSKQKRKRLSDRRSQKSNKKQFERTVQTKNTNMHVDYKNDKSADAINSSQDNNNSSTHRTNNS